MTSDAVIVFVTLAIANSSLTVAVRPSGPPTPAAAAHDPAGVIIAAITSGAPSLTTVWRIASIAAARAPAIFVVGSRPNGWRVIAEGAGAATGVALTAVVANGAGAADTAPTEAVGALLCGGAVEGVAPQALAISATTAIIELEGIRRPLLDLLIAWAPHETRTARATTARAADEGF